MPMFPSVVRKLFPGDTDVVVGVGLHVCVCLSALHSEIKKTDQTWQVDST